MRKILFFMCLILSIAQADYIEELKWGSDTLLGFFKKNSIPLKTYYNLDDEDKTNTEDISQGVKYQILRTDDGEIRQILIPITQELQLHVDRLADNSYKMYVIPVSYQKTTEEVVLEVSNSVTQDIINATNDYNLASEFVSSYNKSINFKQDVKRGNKIAIIYEKSTRMGQNWGNPTIKCAMVETGSNRVENYIFLAKDGIYYNDKATAIESFLLAKPLKNYSRISSGFTLKRWHPILNVYRAHHGIDYATPVGTSIFSAGDGKVTSARYRDGYGKVIEIQHEDGFKTLYAHLNNFVSGMRVGKVVKKGQLIAYSGNSGMSTGPHLHFGLYKRETPIDPNKVIRVAKRSLFGAKKDEFMGLVKVYKDKINILENGGTRNAQQQEINVKFSRFSEIDEDFKEIKQKI